MNFFDAQERSRRNTRTLILLMTLAVVIVVAAVTVMLSFALWMGTATTSAATVRDWLAANPYLPLTIASVTAAFIGLASLYRVIGLRQGGSRVARELGGVAVEPGEQDPLRRRLRNVVEEIAIASGIPAPQIFVLEQEDGINAFAAGFGTTDAVVAVTRGALETLNRDELQGVIAHEFSHILNGDMRLNIRLMGPLFGILAIGLIGRMLLRSVRLRSRGRNNAVPVVLVVGAGLALIGFVGLFAGRLIKAGVSRQREYLADSSAVQFTRQTDGIAGALKKIAGLAGGSTIRNQDAEEVSHMLFATGARHFSSLLATHPPLLKRIQALDPSFTARQLAQLHTEPLSQLDNVAAAGLASALVGGAAAVPAAVAGIVARVGNPGDEHYLLAQQVRARLPVEVSAALESGYGILLLIPALILHPDEQHRQAQLHFLDQQVGSERRARIQELYSRLAEQGSSFRLPVMELALPMLRTQPVARREYLRRLLEQLAGLNNRLELFEYCLLRLYSSYVEGILMPGRQRHWQGLEARAMREAAAKLISVVALHGHAEAALADEAFAQGLAALGVVTERPEVTAKNWVHAADDALETLRDCTPRGRQTIVRALAATVISDTRITAAEYELLRALCSIIECPLPPMR